MTGDQIIKALECHADADLASCKECPLLNIQDCCYLLSKEAADLINRQKADIENLNTVNAEMQAEIGRMKNNAFCNVVIDEETMQNIINEKVAEIELDIKSIKTEAIKEFAEKVELEIVLPLPLRRELHNLVEEKAGDTEC